jgi:hypothetical protein
MIIMIQAGMIKLDFHFAVNALDHPFAVDALDHGHIWEDWTGHRAGLEKVNVLVGKREELHLRRLLQKGTASLCLYAQSVKHDHD